MEPIKYGVTLQQLSLRYDVSRSTIKAWLRKMARSVFYYHLRRLKAVDKYVMEKDAIKSIFHEHKGRYGYRRATAEMRNRGFVINHKTVQRLMDEMSLKSKIPKVRYRSYKGSVGKIAPNIINRHFGAEAPNRKWATDVTLINIGAVKLYLFESPEDFMKALEEYIEYYDNNRIKSRLKGKSPVQYQTLTITG